MNVGPDEECICTIIHTTKYTKNMSLWVTDSSSDDDDETEEVVQVVPPPKKKTQPPKKAQKKQVAPSTSHESPSKKCKT